MNENYIKHQNEGCCLYKLFLFLIMVFLLVVLVKVFGPIIGTGGVIFIGF